MTRYRYVLFLLLIAVSPVDSSASQHRSGRDAWYEKVLRQINPHNTDYAAIFEQRKRDFINQIANPQVQYGLDATIAVVVLLILVFTGRRSHQRSMEIAAQSIADVVRHDQYSRQVACEAIRRYNDHIEACNRVIETSERESGKSIAPAESDPAANELHRINQELIFLRQENQSLRQALQRKYETIAELSLPEKTANPESGQATKHPVSLQEYIDRIHELEKEILTERKKNHRLRAKAPEARRA